jgi:hypothetical protein
MPHWQMLAFQCGHQWRTHRLSVKITFVRVGKSALTILAFEARGIRGFGRKFACDTMSKPPCSVFGGYWATMAKIGFFAKLIGIIVSVSTATVANATIPDISTSIPEPSDFALFLLGVAGLVIGRRSSRKRRQSDDDTKA